MDYISPLVDLMPGFGNFKSGIEFVTGYDPLTFKKKDDFSRAMSGLSVFPFGKIFKYGNTINKVASRTGAFISFIQTDAEHHPVY